MFLSADCRYHVFFAGIKLVVAGLSAANQLAQRVVLRVIGRHLMFG